MNKWIEVTYRKATNEELEMFGVEIECIYDCPLPEDGQEVLITTYRGEVAFTTFYNDDCAYFENWEDIDDVKAWMPLPKPFEKVREK